MSRYLVQQGCIKPLCDLLNCGDNKIIQVTLDGLENILKVGNVDKPLTQGINQMAIYIEEAGGMDKIHQLQLHDNSDIYKKAYHIIDEYFSEEDEETGIAAEVDQTTGTYAFPTQMDIPQGGFQFGGQ